MKVSISIFLGLALIAGAIYYKPSFACSTGNECAVYEGGRITTVDYIFDYDNKKVWKTKLEYQQ